MTFVEAEATAYYCSEIISITGGKDLEVGSNNKIEIVTKSYNGKSITYTVTVTRANDATEEKTAVEEAFKKYIDTVGNAATAANMLEFINSELEGLSVKLLSEENWFIRHAVDGVYDEDPVEADRLSIPGHDGYASAVLAIYNGEEIVSNHGVIATIPHREENLGVLTKDVYVKGSSTDAFAEDTANNITGYSGTVEKIIIGADAKKYKFSFFKCRRN